MHKDDRQAVAALQPAMLAATDPEPALAGVRRGRGLARRPRCAGAAGGRRACCLRFSGSHVAGYPVCAHTQGFRPQVCVRQTLSVSRRRAIGGAGERRGR